MTENTLSRLVGTKKATEKAPVKSEEVREGTTVEATEEKALENTKARPTKEAIARRNRRTRSPVDGRRNILTVKGLAPGMVARWVDNDQDRIEALLEQGYEVVRQKVQVGDIGIDTGKQIGEAVTKRVGGGREQILLQIPEEWYKADQKAKQKIVDEREAAIHGKGKKDGTFYGKVKVADVVPGRRPTERQSIDDDVEVVE
jgi:hypothetical protein